MGNWIEVKDLSSNQWYIAQILNQSTTEIRIHIATWLKGRDEYLTRATCRNRVAKLGTHTNLYLSPSYPFTRKQGSMWNVNSKDLQQAREDFDRLFYDESKHDLYLQRHLIPFVEKSLLCTIPSSELADDMNAFHQHVVKNVVAYMLSASREASILSMLSLLRLILNGHNSCMFFYLKYQGSYSATKHQQLVYTSYLVSVDALAAVPTRHPCRSLYFIDNIDMFIQAGGFRVILQRLALEEVPLTEVVVYCMLLNQAKPCLAQQKRRRSSSSRRRSTVDIQVEAFFRDFLNAVFARLRRMSGNELKDDDRVIDQIVGILEHMYRDGVLLGSNADADADDSSSAGDGSSSGASDIVFAEAIEVFHLDLSKKFVCCPFLGQRLHGLSRINDLISMAQRREALQKKTTLSLRRSTSSLTSAATALTSSSGSRSAYEQPAAKWLRPKYVVEWLTGSDVLEVILGEKECCAKYGLQEGTHLEILKRSRRIFEFVASNGLLSDSHVVLLWKTALNQLRSGRKTIFDVLVSLCGVLSAELMDVLAVLLTQVPLGDYDELLVHFIKRVVFIASKQVVDSETGGFKMSLSSLVSAASGSKSQSKIANSGKDVEVFNKIVNLGCCLLWNAIMQVDANGERLRASVRSDVESALAECLNHIQKLWTPVGSTSPLAKEQLQLLNEYLLKCAENIKAGVLVETSMNLIERIVEGFGHGVAPLASLSLSKGPQAPTSASDLLKELNGTHNIVQLVIEEIRRYMSGAATGGSASTSTDDAILQRRLSFLGYIVTNSDITLTFPAMGELWTCFNDSPASTAKTREIFFVWFTEVIPDPNNFVHRAYSGNTAFSDAVAREIFQALISVKPATRVNGGVGATGIHLQLEGLGKHSFLALERLFRFINTSDKLISCSSAASATPIKSGLDTHDEPAPFIVESMDLKGLDTLYDAALCAEDEDVSQLVVDYIIYLHLHVGSKLVRREVWSDFVGVCLARIRTRMSATPSEKETREVRRLLVLLNTFLNQSTVQVSDGISSALDGPEELTVYVKTQDGRIAAPFKYYMKRTTLVSELRDKISKDTGHPADRIRIVNEQKTKLTAQGHGKFTLEKARVFSAVPTAQTGGARYSSAITVPAPQQRSSKREVAYVEAVLLSKVESDTTGHTNRTVVDYHGNALTGTGAGAGNNTSVESDWRMVKSEISHNDRWVELLFGLLSWSDGIAEEVWKVLKLLDSNYEMEKRTRTLNGVLAIDGSIRKFPPTFDWNVLLDISCPPKLLYQLELVEKFALCVDARPQDNDEEGSQRLSEKRGAEGSIGTVNTWSSSFLQLGGKAHLEQFVLSANHEQLIRQGKLAVMCLSKLLKLLRHFVLVEASIAEEDGDEIEGDPEGLVGKLLQLLSMLQPAEETVSATKADGKAVTGSHTGLPLHLMPYARPQVGDHDNPDDTPCEAYLMTRTLSFIATCALTAMQNALSLIKAYSNHEQLLLRCLVESPFQAVRREAAGVIVALSTTKNKDEADRAKCCSFFLGVLGKFDGDVTGDEYYEVYTLLVSSASDLAEFAFLSSCRILCRRIKSFEPPSESIGRVAPTSLALVRSPTVVRPGVSVSPASSRYAAPPAVDTQLQAIMTTLLTVIRRIPAVLAEGDSSAGVHSLREVVAATLHQEEGIMAELFHRCLFATPSTSENGDTPQAGSGVDSPTSHYYLQQPKCRSDSCRKVAFDLLSELSIDNPSGLSYLLVQMGQQHSLERPPASVVGPSGASALTSSSSKRKSVSVMKEASGSSRQLMQRGKYVGLKNLGCTCYLNSTIQCFFMIPRFRRQILRLTSGPSGADEPSLLYELQSLFAHLEGSAKPYYNPRPFTRAMKTWDGESIDVSVQQDASEFLTSFFQQIESEMNGMDNGIAGGDGLGDENILNTFFGGEFSNELVAEGDRYSERFEPFHFISVPVRDRKNLKESLDGWVEGEKVSYTWESNKNAEDGDDAQTPDGDSEAAEKVTLETHKRISISKLPEYLIIHLKRFEFDFEKMQQIKLHDRFEFPVELDMHPYTKEGQQEKRKAAAAAVTGSSHSGGDEASADAKHDDNGDGSRLGSNGSVEKQKAPEYSQYELAGTVVHMGSAHSGHYYSFLREQGIANGGDDSTNRWYEFNDTLVTPFDPEQIPNECFGGEDESPSRFRSASASVAGAGSSGSASFMKNRSSFMLIYARARPVLRAEGSPGSAVAMKKPTSVSTFAAGALAVAFCTRLLLRARPRLERLRSKAHVVAPEPIRKQIALENRLFWRKKYLYDARCLGFTYELVSSCLVGLESAKSKAMLPTFEPEEAQFDALTMATKFVFGTLWQGGDVSKVLEWRLVLQALYHSDVDGCRWLLKTMSANETLLLELLVLNEHREVRALAASVLAEAIATTSNAGFDSSGVGPSEVVDDGGKLPASFDFVFFLLTLMPALLTAPVHHHGEYFATIYEFVQMGRNEGSFLVVNGVVGAVVALLTGLSASSPLAPPLLAPQLQKHKPRQILKRIDLSGQVLKLLSVLVRCALPPAMDSADRVALPPNMAHDHVDLPKLDRDLLVNERFLTLLSQRASRYSSRETKPLEQLVAHLCWESRRVSTRFIEIVMAGIEREDHQDVKPYFRTLNSVFKVRDTLREWRVADAMPQLVAVMASQQRFYKATETSMDMLTRLAKRHGAIIRWLRDNRANCTWMDKWLAAHRGSEGLLQQRKTLLVKPNSTSSWVNVSVSSTGLVKAVDRAIAKLLPRVRALLEVEAMPETFYDSDDNPARLVGRRVRVKWAKDKWYEGMVERFDEDTYEHFVVYDDGDQRSYHMSDKIFYVVDVAPPPPATEPGSRRQ